MSTHWNSFHEGTNSEVKMFLTRVSRVNRKNRNSEVIRSWEEVLKSLFYFRLNETFDISRCVCSSTNYRRNLPKSLQMASVLNDTQNLNSSGSSVYINAAMKPIRSRGETWLKGEDIRPPSPYRWSVLTPLLVSFPRTLQTVRDRLVSTNYVLL